MLREERQPRQQQQRPAEAAFSKLVKLVKRNGEQRDDLSARLSRLDRTKALSRLPSLWTDPVAARGNNFSSGEWSPTVNEFANLPEPRV